MSMILPEDQCFVGQPKRRKVGLMPLLPVRSRDRNRQWTWNAGSMAANIFGFLLGGATVTESSAAAD